MTTSWRPTYHGSGGMHRLGRDVRHGGWRAASKAGDTLREPHRQREQRSGQHLDGVVYGPDDDGVRRGDAEAPEREDNGRLVGADARDGDRECEADREDDEDVESPANAKRHAEPGADRDEADRFRGD